MNKLLFIFSIFLVFGQCTSKLDFDQARHLNIQPVFEGDILYFDLHKENLTDSLGQFRREINDTLDFAIFKDGKTRDDFVKAEITVGFQNTFERHFETTLFFIDDSNIPVEQANLSISQANNTQPEITGEMVFTFDKNTHPDFVNFRKIVLKVIISPDHLPVEDKTLFVQVKGKFFTNIVIE